MVSSGHLVVVRLKLDAMSMAHNSYGRQAPHHAEAHIITCGPVHQPPCVPSTVLFHSPGRWEEGAVDEWSVVPYPDKASGSSSNVCDMHGGVAGSTMARGCQEEL